MFDNNYYSVKRPEKIQKSGDYFPYQGKLIVLNIFHFYYDFVKVLNDQICLTFRGQTMLSTYLLIYFESMKIKRVVFFYFFRNFFQL